MNVSARSEQIIGGIIGTSLCAAAAELIFGRFFPGPNGLGHDYAGLMPAMLAEYYWSLLNGIWSPPWFTPAFCGGVPMFAEPGSMFYAFPNLLVRLLDLDPLTAAHATFLLFVVIGFLGAYLFITVLFHASVASAMMGAVIFGLNGFFTHRFIIGHLGFHGLMLVPWLALAVCGAPVQRANRLLAEGCRVVLGGFIFAYWVHSGAGSLLIPFAIATAMLVFLHWARGGAVLSTTLRGAGAAVIGVLLSSSKIVASGSYMGNFPRSDYLLPGTGSIFESARLAFLTLFGNLPDIASVAAADWENLQWALGRHELEYGVTAVPLVLICLALGTIVARRQDESSRSTKKLVASLLIILVSVAVLALNTYSPAWNAFLKSVPLVGSSSSLVRWFVIFIPILAAGAALALDVIASTRRAQFSLASFCVIAVLTQTAVADRTFYLNQNYAPETVTSAFREARNSPTSVPAIRFVGAFVDGKGNILMPMNRNDLMTQGISQLACYMAIFGYRLENFPLKTLRPGPALEVQNGLINLKNPVCYVFPEENSCRPGDHFLSRDLAAAERFASYRDFPFERSKRQQLADWVTRLSLLAAALVLIFGAVRSVRGYVSAIRDRNRS